VTAKERNRRIVFPNLESYRKLKEITYKDLVEELAAHNIKMSQSGMSERMQGDVEFRLNEARIIANFLGASIDWLFEINEE